MTRLGGMSRAATTLGELLGDTFRGIVTCDWAKMYWRVERIQWCWAHLGRDFQAMVDGGDKRAKWLGERLRAAACELFEHGAEYRAGNISRAALRRRMGPVRRKVVRLLLRGAENKSTSARGTCRELHEHRQWLWTFLRYEGVEPTNNAGERALRHAVFSLFCASQSGFSRQSAEPAWPSRVARTVFARGFLGARKDGNGNRSRGLPLFSRRSPGKWDRPAEARRRLAHFSARTGPKNAPVPAP